MSVTIDRESRKAIAVINGLDKLTTAGIEHAAYTSGVGLVKNTSKEILRKPKGGRVYIRRDAGGRRRRHVASAPGETHANMTGRLRRSMGFKVRPDELEFGYGVQTNDTPEYAEFVEKTRPSLQNGINSEQRNFQDNFDREIGKRIGAK